MNRPPPFPALILLSLLAAGCAETPMGPDARRGAPASAAAADLTAVPPAATLDASLLQPSGNAYRLGPGDRIAVEVMGSSEIFSAYPPSGIATVTVGPDGKIYYYLLPGIDVWGQTLEQTRDRIAQELTRYVRQTPAVSVSLASAASRRIWILGRVANPGVYPLGGSMTVLDAISSSGGLAASSPLASLASALGVRGAGLGGGGDSADLSHAFLIRQGRVVPVDFDRLVRDGDLSQNIYLQPDDFIFVPSSRSAQVHVLGAVVAPGSQPLRGGLTLVQAVALSGGTQPMACLTDVAILRGSVTHPEIGVVSVRDILRGRAPDVKLEAGDIVYVPLTQYHTLERYADLILDTFARTVGVNEGAKAIAPNAVGVGISVAP